MCHFLTVFLLRRNVCPSPLSIFNWVIWSFHCCIMSSYIFWTFDPYQMYDLQIWSPILRDVFSLSFVLWSKKFLFCFLNFGDCNTYFSLIAYVSGLSNRPYLISMGFPGGPNSKESACNTGDPCSILDWGDPLEKGMTTHSSILAQRIPWTREPGGLQSTGSQRVRHNWVTNTTMHTHNWITLLYT